MQIFKYIIYTCTVKFYNAQSKISADIIIYYCGIIQNIKEKCGGVFTADIYLKIFEDNVLNDKYIFFSHRYL